MKKVNVGILGCGMIAPSYLRNFTGAFSQVVEVTACADTNLSAAAKTGADFRIPHVCSPAELLADPAVELVVNLTPAPAHYTSSLAVLQAGKHLFSEKPLALSRQHGCELLSLAGARGLQIGGAADTFLGASLQFCRSLVEEGRIGLPLFAQVQVDANAFSFEQYHSTYRGALLDLGPYYLTALVAILGPLTAVVGIGDVRFREKPFAADSAQKGQTFPVDFPTTVAGAWMFESGVVASLIASCDTFHSFKRVEIIGTDGSLRLSDANQYCDRVTLRTVTKEESWDNPAGFAGTGRGLGVAEMALALRASRAPRANGQLMYHVLEGLLGVHASAADGQRVRIESRVERPAAFDVAELAVG